MLGLQEARLRTLHQCVFGHCAVAYHPCAFNAGDHTMQIKTRIGEEVASI